jgi:hypothetical protein
MLSYVAFWMGTSFDQRSATVGNGGRAVFSESGEWGSRERQRSDERQGNREPAASAVFLEPG